MDRSFDTSSVTHAVTVTPNDVTGLATVCRAVFVGTSGNLSVLMANGSTAVFKNVSSGQLLPIQAARVNATNTTATDILALY